MNIMNIIPNYSARAVALFVRGHSLATLAVTLLMSLTVGRAEEPTPFVSSSFSAAQTQAAKDSKLVFVDFFTTWCAPCKLLDTTTWINPQVMALLREKVVALRIDAEKEKELAKQYRIEAYPTMLVLKPDGTEVDRYVGYMKADKFQEALTATLAGKTSLQVAREAVKVEEVATPRKRLDLARKLAEADQPAEALALYLWCYDSGPDADPQFATMVNGILPSLIGRLGHKYPPALEALRVRRDKVQQKVFVDPASAEIEAVRRLASLDLALRDDATILETLGRLPIDGRARKTYGGLPMLIWLGQKKHYREALSLGVPETEFGKQLEQGARILESMKASGRTVPETMLAGFKKMPVTTGTIYVVVLAGAGELERARALAEKVLAVQDDDEVRRGLVESLKEAGATIVFRAPGGGTDGPKIERLEMARPVDQVAATTPEAK